MNKAITVLVSFVVAVCCQVAFAQTQTKTKTQAQLEQNIEQAVEEAFTSEEVNAGIKKDPNNPDNVILNGIPYTLVCSEPYGSVYEDEQQPDGTVVRKKVKDYGRVDTYVHGNDTIQAAVYRAWRNPVPDNRHITASPRSWDMSSMESKDSGKGVSSYRKDGAFLVEAYKWGNMNMYELRVKRDTSDPNTRADIEGSTYQAVKNTDIKKTFGSNLNKQAPSAAKVYKNAFCLGPEASWTPKK